jgi:hypothetical protein
VKKLDPNRILPPLRAVRKEDIRWAAISMSLCLLALLRAILFIERA